jgi:hypothetical protein
VAFIALVQSMALEDLDPDESYYSPYGRNFGGFFNFKSFK